MARVPIVERSDLPPSEQECHSVSFGDFQGVYLSPQQAKALLGLLQQNVNGYETAFGEIKLDPRMAAAARFTKTASAEVRRMRARQTRAGGSF